MFMYISVPVKFWIASIVAAVWAMFSYQIAVPWIDQLSEIITVYAAWFIIFGIAIIPGFMNAFLTTSLLLDRRPARRKDLVEYPNITILVAAYNEEKNIASTLESMDRQQYPGQMKVIVIDDGSTDNTIHEVRECAKKYSWLQVIAMPQNGGKSSALNRGLQDVTTDITITIDADCYLYKDALKHLVERYENDPDDTAAVAGAVLVRNSRVNFVTKIQEWDYFHGIAAIKRLQSLFQGTLVAQGAFSLYETAVLREVGGWSHAVGEDIVLTWAILNKDHRVGFAEDAILFTNAPETWGQFIKQRQRWSRGMIEAFKEHGSLLKKPKMYVIFVWWNLLFPYMDMVYTFAFIPGLILALFGVYWIAGPMTLLVLPLAMVFNFLIFTIQNRMFVEQGLKVRRNILGFICYALFYGIILQPACVLGYIHEIFRGAKKSWGTK